MKKIILNIDGMSCGMCESHINDAIRNSFPVKKVTSSHKKGRTEILAETDLPEKTLRAVIGQTGYELVSVETVPFEKKRLFRRGEEEKR